MHRSIWIQGSVWLTVQFAQLWSQTCAWILPVWYIINAYWWTNKAPIVCKILEREKKSSLGGRWSLSVTSSSRCCRVTLNTYFLLSDEGTTSSLLTQLGIGVHTGFTGVHSPLYVALTVLCIFVFVYCIVLLLCILGNIRLYWLGYL